MFYRKYNTNHVNDYLLHLFCLPFSSASAVETTSIQEADQSCAIMLKSMPSLSLGHGERDHLISSSSLSVHSLSAQPGDEPGCPFICCPPDVACPWGGCSFFSLLLQYLIYFQYSQKGGTAGLVRTLTDWRDEKCQIRCSSSFHCNCWIGAPSLTSSCNKWCQREKKRKKNKKTT